MTLYALQIKPRLQEEWVLEAPGGGLHIALTDFVQVVDSDIDAIKAALDSITSVMRSTSVDATLKWKVTTDGGTKAVSQPQKGIEDGTTDSWFISLCCLQKTLGQILAQLFTYDALKPFLPFLFPGMEKGLYSGSKDNLGAWHMELPIGLTFSAAQAYRLRIIDELSAWYLTLVSTDDPTVDPTVAWPDPFPPDTDDGLISIPNLSMLPLSIYPPSGEQCSKEHKRPIGAFPPGACAPPGEGCNSCYFPIRNFPNCCFKRNNYPLAR